MKKAMSSLILLLSCTLMAAQQKPATGKWNGLLERTDSNHIPFRFEITDSAAHQVVYLINGTERMQTDNLTVQGDSVFISLPFFEAQLRARMAGSDTLKGTWIKRLADRNTGLPFTAIHQRQVQKPTAVPPVANLTGKWIATFTDTVSGKTSHYVGVFKQEDAYITGSFLTPYGDYRFLEGHVSGNQFRISGFDGGYALGFTARITGSDSLSAGSFVSGTGATRQWHARKDASATLAGIAPETYRNTTAPEQIHFTFNDPSGQPVSLSDTTFQNKVVLIQILGTWCPNCVDEARFFQELYNRYHAQGLEIIGLAYERSTDTGRSRTAVRNFMRRLQLTYPVLIPPVAAGDPDNAVRTLPQFTRFPAFPTTIILNREGKIHDIRAGFNGPGTGSVHEEEREAYYRLVETLLRENRR